jgi:hypothetical protein
MNGRTSSKTGIASKVGAKRVFGAGAAMKAATGSGACVGGGRSGLPRGSVEIFRFECIPGGGCSGGVEEDDRVKGLAVDVVDEECVTCADVCVGVCVYVGGFVTCAKSCGCTVDGFPCMCVDACGCEVDVFTCTLVVCACVDACGCAVGGFIARVDTCGCAGDVLTCVFVVCACVMGLGALDGL